MKLMLAALLAVVASQAQAVPVMNENSSRSGLATIFPDSADANLFYVAPNYLGVCLDDQGVPRFSYQDIPSGNVTHGIVQMILCSKYNDAALAAAKSSIVASNPNAKFAALPFNASKVVFDPVLEPLIVKQFCDHTAGTVGDEQTCSFRLNSIGRRIFIRQVRDRVAMTMQYQYSVNAFDKNPDGTFTAQTSTFGIAVRIGGDELKSHPELFSDINGRPLKPR